MTLGEGWHNNHHRFTSAARQGFFWWESDVTDCVLRALALVRLIWDVREPPAALLRCPTAPPPTLESFTTGIEG